MSDASDLMLDLSDMVEDTALMDLGERHFELTSAIGGGSNGGSATDEGDYRRSSANTGRPPLAVDRHPHASSLQTNRERENADTNALLTKNNDNTMISISTATEAREASGEGGGEEEAFAKLLAGQSDSFRRRFEDDFREEKDDMMQARQYDFRSAMFPLESSSPSANEDDPFSVGAQPPSSSSGGGETSNNSNNKKPPTSRRTTTTTSRTRKPVAVASTVPSNKKRTRASHTAGAPPALLSSLVRSATGGALSTASNDSVSSSRTSTPNSLVVVMPAHQHLSPSAVVKEILAPLLANRRPGDGASSNGSVNHPHGGKLVVIDGHKFV